MPKPAEGARAKTFAPNPEPPVAEFRPIRENSALRLLTEIWRQFETAFWLAIRKSKTVRAVSSADVRGWQQFAERRTEIPEDLLAFK